MKENRIDSSGVVISNGEILRDEKDNPSSIKILIFDEYIKSITYQKLIREKESFLVGGELLYLLLSELFDYISDLYNKIRLDDVDIHDDGNRNLLFLRKFSRSSEIIENKIQMRSREKIPYKNNELFQIHINGKGNCINFSRKKEKQSKLAITLPAHYLFNRLISQMDKMNYIDLMTLDKPIRNTFLKKFIELHEKVTEKSTQIDIRYAMELAQDRIRDLEKENNQLHNKVSLYDFQNKLYKRSYFSLKNRYSKLQERYHVKEEEDGTIQEIKPIQEEN